MEYTIKQICDLAGISTRTLRYYDEIDLLKASRKNGSGYRIYTYIEVDKLQLIMFFRELGMKLNDIKDILDDSMIDYVDLLTDHKQKLLLQKQKITLEQKLLYQGLQ